MDLKIRLVKKEDLKELGKIFKHVYDNFDVGEKWTLEPAIKLMEYWYNLQPDLAFLAEDDGKIVGAFFAGVKPWWDGNHLIDGEFFVHTDCQGKGVGTKLSLALYKEALKKYDVKSFDTFTFKKKKFPLEWYKSQGFSEINDWVMIEANLNEVVKNLEKKLKK